MNLVRIFLLLGALVAYSFGASSSMENLLFNGRWAHDNGVSRASAPAASITFNAKASKIMFTVEGRSRWRLDRDGKQIEQLEVDSREERVIKVEDDGSFHKYRFIKISESGVPEIKFYGISVDGELAKPLNRPIAASSSSAIPLPQAMAAKAPLPKTLPSLTRRTLPRATPTSLLAVSMPTTR